MGRQIVSIAWIAPFSLVMDLLFGYFGFTEWVIEVLALPPFILIELSLIFTVAYILIRDSSVEKDIQKVSYLILGTFTGHLFIVPVVFVLEPKLGLIGTLQLHVLLALAVSLLTTLWYFLLAFVTYLLGKRLS